MDLGGSVLSRNIPSDADFNRAFAAMKSRSRGLSEVRDSVLNQFKSVGVLYEFFILDSSENSFRACVFYPLDKNIREAQLSGIEAVIKNVVYSELYRVGRGDPNNIVVEFELDSHENVERRFQGDYYNRLR